MKQDTSPTFDRIQKYSFCTVFAVLVLVLFSLFNKSFDADQVLFSNDGPLGAQMADALSLPESFAGIWHDLNWVGGWQGNASPNVTYALAYALGPIAYAKYYTPLAVLFLGLSAWFCLRQLGLRPLVCVAGGCAAALNTSFFSYACWGLGSLTLTVAAVFLAVAALSSRAIRNPYLGAILAGAAIGLALMEGYDNGAIFSLYIAAFTVFLALTRRKTVKDGALHGFVRVALVAGCAALVAAQTLSSLISTQLTGVVGASQSEASDEQNWDWATQWSLPKTEVLRVIVPGIFGYRMDTPDGGFYWGGVGQTPGAVKTRHSGSGVYAGVLVVLMALWGLIQSFRRDGPFETRERKIIWFWACAALISLLLAFGRHAPFYQFFYGLPQASSIRNPVKFMHPFNLSMVLLFAYGLEGLVRAYLNRARGAAEGESWVDQFKGWWRNQTGFNRNWTVGSIIAVAVSLFAWFLYATSKQQLELHLRSVLPDGATDETIASVAAFSIGEVGWSVVFLALGAFLVVAIMSGVLAGRRQRWAWIGIAVLLLADLARANVPWIVHYNYKVKYATNPIIDFLRDDPRHARVTAPQLPLPAQFDAIQQTLLQVYRVEWMQHHFHYYNIPSLDIIQMPRVSESYAAFNTAFAEAPLRLWQLTSTRYLLSLSQIADVLNKELDPEGKPFQNLVQFTLAQGAEGSIDAVLTTNGPFALVEYSEALPRAGLMHDWAVVTNDFETLQRLRSAEFDPARTVLLATAPGGEPAAATAPAGSNSNSTSTSTNAAPEGVAPPPASRVKWVKYAPKQLILETESELPSVLLINDAYHANWRVLVDGESKPLLRANYLMRGVYLSGGRHVVELEFALPNRSLFISLGAIAASLALCGYVVASRRRGSDASPNDDSETGEPLESTAPRRKADRDDAPSGSIDV